MKITTIIALSIIISFTSCKKNVINQSELVGTWAEIQPCIDSPRCYTYQFTNHNKVYVLSPFIDTANYSLTSNNSILLDNSAIKGSGIATSGIYQFTLTDSIFIIKKAFIFPRDSAGLPDTILDICLKRN